ncbi:MAG: glycosyltransferase family 4 protein [Chlorobi bacterium]|nr:glycosyltransferase family 4 protein [Chlorobiota bacterium]
MEDKKLYLALSKGENFGWGVCSKYLKQETPKFYENVSVWDFENDGQAFRKADGIVFHALTGTDFIPIAKIWGDRNYGYTFFENELSQVSLQNAKRFEKVIGGSTWNEEKMKALGVENADTLIQGIDPDIFYPIEEEKSDELFVIFSGGKFELRKGQDLVLEAVKILQKKYDDVVLMNAWYNMWPASMELFQYSKRFKFERKGESWPEVMSNIYNLNDVDENRIITLDLVNNKKLRSLYAKTDVALFPNRCEGGTNLVMMEYLACGKPVIASYTSGHKDVLNENHALLLKENVPFRINDANGNLWADWEEPSLDEIVAKLEFAYNNRDSIKLLGKNAGEYMKNFTWEKSAEQLVKIIAE